ncbi:MAG: DUF309 domain-containing protein [Bacteroidota bacterium]|nr:DUF309 domain-containing protein [Bacteroidota bacterium]
MPPRKRATGEITTLQVPPFTEEQWTAFLDGCRLFNRGKYWHAHESWEAAWLPMGDDGEDDAEIFLRALIQLASGLHLKRIGRYKGARSQFAKAESKFSVMPTFFMELDIAALRVFAAHQLAHFSEDLVCLLRRRDAAS